MEYNISVSKGIFVFKSNLQALKRKGKYVNTQDDNICNIYTNQRWYKTYTNLWRCVESKINKLNQEMFSHISTNLLHFIKNSYQKDAREIPAAALLTGINMPDHVAQFSTLIKKIKQDVSPHVACLYSQDCQNIKCFMENMIHQFIKNISNETSFETENKYKIKKSQYKFSNLLAWYEKEHGALTHQTTKRSQYQRKILVVIIPDFEGVNEKVLQEFILIASSYINVLPLVLVFGVATSLSMLHKMLPYRVSSKVKIQYFNSQPSAAYLNNILENVFFSNDCAFHLGGRVFGLLMDTFLFYDLSVTCFLKKYKYAMLMHFSYGNVMTLCSKRRTVDVHLDHEDCESARRLPSFRNLVESESNENKIKLLTDDVYFKDVLRSEIIKIQEYLRTFHLFLKCLNVLIADFPKNSLGKQMRELYSVAVSTDITKTKGYEACLQLLQCQSMYELNDKMTQIVELVECECKICNSTGRALKDDLKNISLLLNEMQDSHARNLDTDVLIQKMENINVSDRKQFKENLFQRTRAAKPFGKYEAVKLKLIKFLDSLFEKYLHNPTKLYFHEIFFFNDGSIENRVIGSQRAAIHTALNDPHQYLQCDCCEMHNEAAILRTMPDICIAYKLHLEYGKMINLYDWLQGFSAILNPVFVDDVEDEGETEPALQARFTLVVAEMELLGFIKSSKRKRDHVQRLTWGG